LIVGVPDSEFSLTGELAAFDTTGEDHGRETHRRFCPQCGSPVISESDGLPGIVLIKAGTLDDPSWLEPQIEVWGRSAHGWIAAAEGRPRLERGPNPA
jgi:hypothetical protein